jgi:hypothetical protein
MVAQHAVARAPQYTAAVHVPLLKALLPLPQLLHFFALFTHCISARVVSDAAANLTADNAAQR